MKRFPRRRTAGGANDEDEESTPEKVEVLDEEFQCYQRVANSLKASFKRPKDGEVATDLLKQVEALNRSSSLEVKKQTNKFFQYYLKILNWTSINQPTNAYKNWYEELEGTKDPSLWLEDQKSYMASKTLDDGTVLVYVAVANDPSAGWQENGLRALNEAQKRET